MIIQFQTNNVTFFEEDKTYFETKLTHLQKLLGSTGGDEDTVNVHVAIEKNKHTSGDRFEAHCTMTCPRNGKFHSDVTAENIKKCADLLHDKLKAQVTKFHDKKVNN